MTKEQYNLVVNLIDIMIDSSYDQGYLDGLDGYYGEIKERAKERSDKTYNVLLTTIRGFCQIEE